MRERWKPVNEFYSVSNLGRVRSEERVIIRSNGSPQTCPQKVRSTKTGKNGYELVTMNIDKKQVTRTVHSLVAEAFIGPRPDGWDVRHKDGNRRNNVSTNLQYGTRTENLLDAREHGSSRFKLVRRGDGKVYPSAVHAEEDGFSARAIRNCCLGKTKSSGGYSWTYA